jgi:hypothetical protein
LCSLCFQGKAFLVVFLRLLLSVERVWFVVFFVVVWWFMGGVEVVYEWWCVGGVVVVFLLKENENGGW